MASNETLVDANVLLDLVTNDPQWAAWSARALGAAREDGRVAINPIILAEVSIGFSSAEECNEAFPEAELARHDLPWEAAFVAGQAFMAYRRGGGSRRSPLPDFYIGAHAQVAGLRLLTRDAERYRTYFPDVQLVTP